MGQQVFNFSQLLLSWYLLHLNTSVRKLWLLCILEKSAFILKVFLIKKMTRLPHLWISVRLWVYGTNVEPSVLRDVLVALLFRVLTFVHEKHVFFYEYDCLFVGTTQFPTCAGPGVSWPVRDILFDVSIVHIEPFSVPITVQGCLPNAVIAYHACFDGVLCSERLCELFVFLSLTFVALANNPLQPDFLL